MNILRNLEAVVIVATALTFVTAVATAATTPAPVVKAAPAAVAVNTSVSNIATVVVTGKRSSTQAKMKSNG